MPPDWLVGVRGTQVIPLITSDSEVIRVEAGPGTGKTFGVVRRVQRIVHPDGLNVLGDEVLVVAFNRVIAKQLNEDIGALLSTSPNSGAPKIRTVHALCLEVLGQELRLLLPHERECLLYDVLDEFPFLRGRYGTFRRTDQALRDHEAALAEDMQLWQGTVRWLTRHRARLVSDLPSLLLDTLHAGTSNIPTFSHVIVDEFQDLTPGEQQLALRMWRAPGSFLALGDSRQSIYAFRGNDREGLNKLPDLLPAHLTISDLPMFECQRCTEPIVSASNVLMGLYGAHAMTPSVAGSADVHVVVWQTPDTEAAGMARAIIDNFRAHPEDRHLVMVTRRQFGFWLRSKMLALDPSIRVELGFSESLLETWSIREAFLFFSLLTDPDPPTWRAWLGYTNSETGRDFKAPKRNASAYLRFLSAVNDHISDKAINALASEPRNMQRGGGGANLWDRGVRYRDLRAGLRSIGGNAIDLVEEILQPDLWVTSTTEDEDIACIDLNLLRAKALEILQEVEGHVADATAQLRQVTRRLRYVIATREPLTASSEADLQVATLWGAKGVTAEHVYVIGLCNEALPGQRRDDYPGTEEDHFEEQRRLFYVSLTRAKRTLVLSRAERIARGVAARLGLAVEPGPGPMGDLAMCPFLRDVRAQLPQAVMGESWAGVNHS